MISELLNGFILGWFIKSQQSFYSFMLTLVDEIKTSFEV